MGDFEHTIHLQAQLTCACGHHVERAGTVPENVDTLSLSRLAQLATGYAQATRCLCGAFRGRVGVARASYRPAGQHQCVVATAHLRDRAITASLSVRDSHPGESSHPLLERLPGTELDAAGKLGEPASVRAAWAEALFQLALGASQVTFPAGAGVQCIASTDPDAHGDLDLTALRTADADPAQWLPAEELRSDRVICLIVTDHLALLSQLVEQAHMLALSAVRLTGFVALSDPHGTFTVPVESAKLAYSAASHGHPVAVHARHLVREAAQRVHELDDAAVRLVLHVGAVSARPTADQRHLALQMPGGHTITVDMDLFLAASAPEQERMLNHWRTA